MHHRPPDLAGLVGSDGSVDRLKAIGLTSEIIAWRLRLFIPAGERGPAILGQLAERHPILRCVPRAVARSCAKSIRDG